MVAWIFYGRTLRVMLPFAWASTYEAWTDGFYDAELNDDALALLSLQAVISDVALTEGVEAISSAPWPGRGWYRSQASA